MDREPARRAPLKIRATLPATSTFTTSAPRWVLPSKPRYGSSTLRRADRPTGQPARHTPAATICSHCASVSFETTAPSGVGNGRTNWGRSRSGCVTDAVADGAGVGDTDGPGSRDAEPPVDADPPGPDEQPAAPGTSATATATPGRRPVNAWCQYPAWVRTRPGAGCGRHRTRRTPAVGVARGQPQRAVRGQRRRAQPAVRADEEGHGCRRWPVQRRPARAGPGERADPGDDPTMAMPLGRRRRCATAPGLGVPGSLVRALDRGPPVVAPGWIRFSSSYALSPNSVAHSRPAASQARPCDVAVAVGADQRAGERVAGRGPPDGRHPQDLAAERRASCASARSPLSPVA